MKSFDKAPFKGPRAQQGLEWQDRRPKVFVAMSGGVDSSVVAALLSQSGNFDVIGAHMKCWSEGEYCTSERDAEDARRVAAKLDIPFYVFDFEREYRDKVFDYMVKEYSAGRTPNPDVMCNKVIKFGIFLEKALALGADFVATGHYVVAKRYLTSQTGGSPAPAAGARLRSRHGDSAVGGDQARRASESFSKANIALLQAKDLNKDQSYFLWTLTQEQLKHCMFPVGYYLKSEVREMAKKFDLPTAAKKDSQGLCFVGEIKFDDFLREVMPKREGVVVTISGREVGRHDGVEFYTIGQRRGIRIGGGVPYYVADKDFKTNTLVVAEGPYDDGLFKNELMIANVNWISGVSPRLPLECEARIRYRQPLQKTTIISSMTDGYLIRFVEPQRAVTPGQSVVFYHAGEMLGGGVIE
ncbi:MAG: tRNA 2-thiouridine(34) synthase MnmA [Patescibacteria group bacterium]